MSSRKKTLRKIVVDGQSYLWKVEHDHKVLPAEPSQGQGASGCREVFSAFLAGHRTSPLRIRFPDGPGQSSGYPAAGVVWTSGPAGLTANLNTPRIAWLEGDAAQRTDSLARGSVFFLYCPFSGARLEQLLDGLEAVARARPIRICCVDLALPPRPWLLAAPPARDLVVYRSTGPAQY